MTEKTFIAGGSKGLGAELVKVFSINNCQVNEFSRSGEVDGHIYCDFSDTESTAKVVKNQFSLVNQNQTNKINLIINTATLAPFGSLTDASAETVKQHLAINIESTVVLLQTFLIAFQNHPADKTIAYISSGAARRAIPGLAMYSASKAFFERFIDTLAVEQSSQPQPIDCMVINPGVMNTGMQEEIRAQDPKDFPMVDMWNELHKQGKLANPKDIADICYRLINEEGKNGGYYTAQDYLKDQ